MNFRLTLGNDMKTDSTAPDNSPSKSDYERLIEIILTKPDLVNAWYEYKKGCHPNAQNEGWPGPHQTPLAKSDCSQLQHSLSEVSQSPIKTNGTE